jgi:hypothetical protein
MYLVSVVSSKSKQEDTHCTIVKSVVETFV